VDLPVRFASRSDRPALPGTRATGPHPVRRPKWLGPSRRTGGDGRRDHSSRGARHRDLDRPKLESLRHCRLVRDAGRCARDDRSQPDEYVAARCPNPCPDPDARYESDRRGGSCGPLRVRCPRHGHEHRADRADRGGRTPGRSDPANLGDQCRRPAGNFTRGGPLRRPSSARRRGVDRRPQQGPPSVRAIRTPASAWCVACRTRCW